MDTKFDANLISTQKVPLLQYTTQTLSLNPPNDRVLRPLQFQPSLKTLSTIKKKPISETLYHESNFHNSNPPSFNSLNSNNTQLYSSRTYTPNLYQPTPHTSGILYDENYNNLKENYYANTLNHNLRKIELTKNGFFINNKPTILRGGSFQWFKLPKEVWEDRILRFKSAGYNTIDMYVSWRNHETQEGKFDFEKYDVKRFLELAKKHNMHVIFRPGPYICNEMDSGGLPGWLIAKSRKDIVDVTNSVGSVNIRTNQKDYLDAVKKYFHKVNEVIKPYLHTNGGPIILYAVENEYDWFLLLKEFDKNSTLDKKPERPINQNPNVRDYLEKLTSFARNDGIDVPITTCPGSGKLTGLDNARDLFPMPNMYTGLKNAEYQTVNLINDMHSSKYNGLYDNHPAGLTETSRDPNVIRRLILGGMNSVIQFNNLGYFQDGYQNAIIINGFLFDSAKGALENLSKMLDYKSPNTAFIRPSIGFFPGKGDYFGSAIGPSGVFRDNYYNIRRTNMFIDSFEGLIAKAYKPNRTFDDPRIPNQDRRIMIKNNQTGIKDPDRPRNLANYWLELGKETALIGVYNDGQKDRNLGINSISAFGNVFPKYTNLVVPIEHGINTSSYSNKMAIDKEYTMFLPYNFPLSENVKLNYSTSEVLSLRDFNNEKLLVVYGKAGTFGEMKLDGKNIKPTSLSDGIKINASSSDSFTISYTHGIPHSLGYIDEEGKKGRIVILDTHSAGKTWFVDTKDRKSMLSGVDYIDTSKYKSTLDFSLAERNDNLIVYSDSPVSVSESTVLKPFDPISGLSILKIDKSIPHNLFNIDLSIGKIMSDFDEAKPEYITNDWIRLGDKPQHLEKHGIYHGHSWYRAEFNLDKKDLLQKSGLQLEHAGDFEGIYINGHYINTLTPIGTEINSNSSDKSYQFNISKQILKEGKNTIAFKTEIWGHGGILLPQGTLNRVNAFGYSFEIPFIKLKIPAISYDSLKGLSGDAKFNNKPIINWKLRPGLGGIQKEYHKPAFNDSRWQDLKVPFSLKKGEVLWYRTSFNYSDIPNKDKYFAPLALKLLGTNSKATIYLNGRVIGRWLSDDVWLKRGGWFKPIKDVWTTSTTDEFPIPQENLRNGKNVFSIAFEDTSGNKPNDLSGKIDTIKMNIATEAITMRDGKYQHCKDVYKKTIIKNY